MTSQSSTRTIEADFTTSQSNSTDEEEALYVPVPGIENDDISLKSRTAVVHFSWAYILVATIQITLFVQMTSYYGFAHLESNPFYGPPINAIDSWGSKNPSRIKNDGEYWRVVTAIFLNIGLTDLTFSLAVLFLMSYHLEGRWGNWKWLTIYLFSGICGNIYGTQFDIISVGSGGCILGMLGAMHVEIIYSIMYASIKEDNYEHNIDDSESENDGKGEKEDLIVSFTSDDENIDSEEDTYLIRSTCMILGLTLGIFVTTMIGIIFPNNETAQKDWSVLYGGMISGMAISLLWNFCVSFRKSGPREIRVAHGLVLLVVPSLLNYFFLSQLSHVKGNKF
jgi:membrane associated rhomboid family serine protease